MLEFRFDNGMDSIALEQDRLTIGRDPGNDIVFDDSRVSGFHANIIKNIDTFEIVDLGSSNGTFVNGEFLKGRRVLRPWDEIKLGGISIEVVDTEGRRPTTVQPVMDGLAMADGARAADRGDLFLKLVSSGDYPAEVVVGGSLSIGRSQANMLQLDAPTVSSAHAEITASGGRYELVDKGSTNGTFVNGRKVSQAFLKHGDKIAFDQVVYLFQDPGADVSKTVVNPALNDVPAATVLSLSLSPSSPSSASAATGPSPALSAPKIRPASEFLEDEPEPAQDSGPLPPPSAPAPAQVPAKPAASAAGVAPRHASASRRGVKWLYFSTEGRIPRMTYFLGILGMMAAFIPIYVAMFAVLGDRAYVPGSAENVINTVVMNAIGLYPMIALNSKRLHDLGRTGSWVWVFVVSILGGILMAANPELIAIGGIAQLAGFVLGVYLLFFKGNAGENAYGQPYRSAK